jgi:hypothetical protein
MLQEPDMKNFAHYLAESERTYNYRIFHLHRLQCRWITHPLG